MFRPNRSAWRAHMGEVSRMLMPWAIADDAVEDFLRKLDPLLNMFNRVILRSKQRELRGNLHGQVRSVEPAITRSVVGSLGSSFASDESYSDDVRHYSLLSVVFAVLRIVGYLAPPERALYLLRLRGEADLKPTLERLQTLAVMFLDESDYIRQPTLWSLQSIFMVHVIRLNVLDPHASAVWNSTAVRLAQTMGIHRLGSASMDLHRWKQAELKVSSTSSEPGYSPLREFAPGDFARRELGRHIWYELLVMDWLAGAHVDACFSVSETLNRTAPPCTLEDEELYRISELPINDRERLERWVAKHEQPTFQSIFADLARCVRDITQTGLDALYLKGRPDLDTTSIQHFDDRMRRIVRGMPAVFQLDVPAPSLDQVSRLHIMHPRLAIQRLMLHNQLHYRLMSLHRTDLARPLGDPAYASAAKACLDAARVLFVTYQELAREQSPINRLGFAQSYVLHAVMILYTIATKWSEVPSHALKAEPDAVEELKRALALLEEAPPLAVMYRYPMISSILAKAQDFCAAHKDRSSPSPPVESFLVLPDDSSPVPDWNIQNLQDLDQWLTELFPSSFSAEKSAISGIAE